MESIQGIDRYDAEWTIFEIDRPKGRYVNRYSAHGWLYFERSDGHRVRVARGEYPPEWRSVRAEALLELIGRGGTSALANERA